MPIVGRAGNDGFRDAVCDLGMTAMDRERSRQTLPVEPDGNGSLPPSASHNRTVRTQPRNCRTATKALGCRPRRGGGGALDYDLYLNGANELRLGVKAICPAIITEAIFASVQRSLKAANPKTEGSRVVTGRILLTEIACCDLCESAMTLRTGMSSIGPHLHTYELNDLQTGVSSS